MPLPCVLALNEKSNAYWIKAYDCDWLQSHEGVGSHEVHPTPRGWHTNVTNDGDIVVGFDRRHQHSAELGDFHSRSHASDKVRNLEWTQQCSKPSRRRFQHLWNPIIAMRMVVVWYTIIVALVSVLMASHEVLRYCAAKQHSVTWAASEWTSDCTADDHQGPMLGSLHNVEPVICHVIKRILRCGSSAICVDNVANSAGS